MKKLIPGIIIILVFLAGVYCYYKYAPDEWNLFHIFDIKASEEEETPESWTETETEKETSPYENLEPYSSEGFIYRAYTVLLEREPDEKGFKDWTDALKDGSKTGVGAVLAFMETEEFIKRNLDGEELVKELFTVLLNRDPSGEDIDKRLAYLSDGVSTDYILKSVSSSEEFRNKCERSGFEPGEMVLTKGRDLNLSATRFVKDAYVILLGREADETGLDSFTSRLSTGKIGPAGCIYAILNSKEFGKKNISDEDAVDLVYRSLLGRETDPKGRENSLDRLKKGVSIDYIVKHISASEEYKSKAQAIRCSDVEISVTENRDQDIGVTEFVSLLYRNGLGREPDIKGLNSWTGALLAHTMDASDVVKGFLLGKEATSKDPDKEQFISMVMRSMTGMEPEVTVHDSLMEMLDSGMSKEDLINEVAESADFRAYCDRFGVKAIKVQTRDIDMNRPMIALTFDDGPSYTNTPVVLDILEEYNARATFFVVGTNASRLSDIIRRGDSLGCEIGNHTVDHSYLTGKDASEIVAELSPVSDTLESVIGKRPAVIRPPYGAVDDNVKANSGMPLILWSVDTRDWATKNAESTYNAVMDNVEDGDIVLMHDIHATTVEAVKRLIPDLIDKGYQLVTVSELARYKGYTLEPGRVYLSFKEEQ